jgi:type IV pilus assembly protein PilB
LGLDGAHGPAPVLSHAGQDHPDGAISELLDLSDAIRALILEKRPASEIKRAARAEGMRFLRESALERVFSGTTTLREVNKVTFVE